MIARHVLLPSLLLAAAAAVSPAAAQDEDSPFWDIPWVEGPAVGTLGKEARVAVPEGCLFTGEDGVPLFNELTENIPNPGERGILICGGDWFVVFTYDDIGHVKDDESAALDADEILKSMVSAQKAGNKERVKRGWPELTLDGWKVEPHYDVATHNLTWATSLRSSDDDESVNHSVRLLGREGVMEVDLVAAPEAFEAALPSLDSILGGFEFVAGQRYAEWQPGDKLAEYGLTGLIVGGAAAAAVKTGLLARLWKLLVAGAVAVVAAVKRMFGRGADSAARA